MSRARLIPLILLALAACREEVDETAACGADELQELVGQSPDMMGMMDIPMDARMLGPDSVATTDFVPDRLNISYDEDGVVTRVWCG